jgi:SNF2 family DNA or RNA helicase
MREGKIKRVLVICPLSIMKSAWQGDLFKTAMHRTCGIAHGSKRRKVIEGEYQFVIINYDGVSSEREAIANAGFDLIIVDEANAYKNTSTVRWKTLASIIKPSTYLWMMTGTPASQSPEDAFGLARLINPSRVPKYKTAWKDTVMTQVSRFRWVPKPYAKQLVFNALQPAIRYEKAQCLDLPEVTYQSREVPLTAQATGYYKELVKQMQIMAVGETISTVNAAAALTKLLQLSGGAVYTDGGNVVEFDVSPRLNVLHEVLEESLHKVIVFVPYTHTLSLIKNFLNKHNISSEIIAGSVSANERAAIFNRFQTQDDPKVLLIQPQAASHGVTLTAADTVVFWSPVMSVETYLQCIARIDRVGQKNSMTVIHLQGSEVERRMYRMLQNKVDMHEQLVDLYRQEIEGESNEQC